MIARIVAFGLLAGMATQAFAFGSVSGKVIDIRVDRSGLGMVTFDQQIGGAPPGCVHAAYTNAFGFDTNTPGGRAILAAALAAKASGDTVTAYGTGECASFGNNWVEDWSYGHVR
jgi:hypothetical protein